MQSTYRKPALISAVCFFIIWLLFMYAISDHPLPEGFYWAIIADIVLAVLVFWRVPTYIDWTINRKKNRRWRVLLEGIATALVLGLLVILFNTNIPRETMTISAYITLLIIFSFFGALSTGLIYIINALFFRKKRVSTDI